MVTLDIEVNFKQNGTLKLYKQSWTEHVLRHWFLRASDILNRFDFKMKDILTYDATISAEEFLQLVGKTKAEAIEIILKETSYNSVEDANTHITREVRKFYTLLEQDTIKSVYLKIVDQS